MGFLRRLFGGQAVPAQLPKHGDRPNLTAVVDVVPTRLDPSWPVVPTERQPQTLSTDATHQSRMGRVEGVSTVQGVILLVRVLQELGTLPRRRRHSAGTGAQRAAASGSD